MKIFNKFIWFKKEPINKNDIWFDGSTFKIYIEGSWEKLPSKIILDIEKLGEPIETNEYSMRYSKEQFENAIGMSILEFFEKIKTSEFVLSHGQASFSPYYIVADEYSWAGYYRIPGLYSYVFAVNAEDSEIFLSVYDETADLPFATTDYVDEKHAQTEVAISRNTAQITQVGVDVGELFGKFTELSERIAALEARAK